MVALVAGCIVLPTPPLGINEIPAERLRLVRPTSMTRVDVLMALGDPNDRLLDDRVFVYRWSRMRAVLAIMYVPPAPISDKYAFIIEFDVEGRVARSGDISAFTDKEFQEELDLWLRNVGASTGTAGEATAAPMATGAVTAASPDAPAFELASTPWFDGPALWRSASPSGAHGPAPPPQGVEGRLVVSAGGVVFFEGMGTLGSEAPYRVARDAIARVECLLRSFMIVRADGTTGHFVVLRAAGDAYDDATTVRVCQLVRESLAQAPQ